MNDMKMEIIEAIKNGPWYQVINTLHKMSLETVDDLGPNIIEEEDTSKRETIERVMVQDGDTSKWIETCDIKDDDSSCFEDNISLENVEDGHNC